MLVRALCAIFLMGAAPTALALDVPPLSSPVVDQARFLSPSAEKNLVQFLEELKEKSGHELAVLTVPSLEGLPIEEYSIAVVEKWQLGSKEEDNGVLLLVSKADRTLRIEVGQGLEGDLTDAHSKRIIEEVVVPQFRNGRFEEGIFLGVLEIAERIFPDGIIQQPSISSQHPSNSSNGSLLALFLVVCLFIFIMPLIAILRNKSDQVFTGRGGFRGPRGGGFGGGFGGFGGGSFGGGGGFSGGGATGRW